MLIGWSSLFLDVIYIHFYRKSTFNKNYCSIPHIRNGQNCQQLINNNYGLLSQQWTMNQRQITTVDFKYILHSKHCDYNISQIN